MNSKMTLRARGAKWGTSPFAARANMELSASQPNPWEAFRNSARRDTRSEGQRPRFMFSFNIVIRSADAERPLRDTVHRTNINFLVLNNAWARSLQGLIASAPE